MSRDLYFCEYCGYQTTDETNVDFHDYVGALLCPRCSELGLMDYLSSSEEFLDLCVLDCIDNVAHARMILSEKLKDYYKLA